jgi:hypothetical protein
VKRPVSLREPDADVAAVSAGSRSEPPLIPLSPRTGSGPPTDGNQPARPDPASLPKPPAAEGTATAGGSERDIDVTDLQHELDLIHKRLDAGGVVDSENWRSTRRLLERQKREIEEKLGSVA